MRIVLHESSYSCQPAERTRRLVAVQDGKLCHANRQLPVGAILCVEDDTVARAVHRLDCPLLLLDVEVEHVFLVVLPVAGRLPQLDVENVGRDDFLVAALPVLAADELDKGVVYAGAVREEEAAAGADIVEEE